jgi:flagellar protein FliL
MATTQIVDADEDAEIPSVAAAPAKSKRKIVLLLIIVGAILLVLGGAGAAAYATGLLSKLASRTGSHATVTPGGMDLPEIVSNLNAGSRRTAFVRLKARLELANMADEPAVLAAQPRIQDLFQTYLRDMRPEELRGSAGTYRLREELLARVNIALAPARVTDILFIELLVQ